MVSAPDIVNRRRLVRQLKFLEHAASKEIHECRPGFSSSTLVGCLQNPELEPLLTTHLSQVRSVAHLSRKACLLLRSSTKTNLYVMKEYCLIMEAGSKST